MYFEDIEVKQQFILDNHLFMKVLSKTTDINAVSLITGQCAHVADGDGCELLNVNFDADIG